MSGAGVTTIVIVLIAYLGMLLVLGYISLRRGKASEEDYYLAGRDQGWLVTSLTIMATFFSSFALLGAPGMVYMNGVVFALFSLNVPVAGFAVYVLGAPIWRLGKRFGFVTPGDMLAHYYHHQGLRLLVALTGLLYVVPYVVIQIQAGGLIFNALFPDPIAPNGGMSNFDLGAIMLASVTTLYILLGGMRSVAWTDVVQGLLLIGGMFLGGWVAVMSLGGWGGFTAHLADLDPAWLTAPGGKGDWPIWKLLTVCLFGSVASMVTPAQWMRFYAARSTSVLRRSAVILAVVLTACFLLGTMLVGLGGVALYPPTLDALGAPQVHEAVGKADQILVVLLMDRLPVVLPTAGALIASIIVVAIMASSMSTADSNVHALSAVVVRDVYGRFIRPQASDRERTWVGRLIILATTAAALGLVIAAQRAEPGSSLEQQMGMIVQVALVAMAFSAQLLPALCDALFLRKGSSWGVTLGLAAGLVVVAMFPPLNWFHVGPIGPLVEWLGSQVTLFAGVWGLIVNLIVFAVVSAFTRKPDPERVAEYAEVLSRHVPKAE